MEPGFMMTLDEVIFRNANLHLSNAAPGFYRLTPGMYSNRAEPLINIPESRLESWAFEWHRQSSYVHDIGCYISEDIVVSENMFLYYDKKSVYQSDIVVPYIRSLIRDDEKRSEKKLVHIDKPCVIAFDRGYKTYGHVLLDSIPRMWLFERMFGYMNLECSLLLPADAPLWIDEILMTIFPKLFSEVLRVDLTCKDVFLEKAIIPTHIHANYRFHPIARHVFNDFVNRIGNVDKRADKKLWIARSNVRSNRMVDCQLKIEEYAKLSGLLVIHPQNIKWIDQVREFNSAIFIGGEYGSALHNSIFCADGIVTLALDRLQFVQSYLGALNQQRLAYLMPDGSEYIEKRQVKIFGFDRVQKAIDKVVDIANKGRTN